MPGKPSQLFFMLIPPGYFRYVYNRSLYSFLHLLIIQLPVSSKVSVEEFYKVAKNHFLAPALLSGHSIFIHYLQRYTSRKPPPPSFSPSLLPCQEVLISITQPTDSFCPRHLQDLLHQWFPTWATREDKNSYNSKIQ